MAGKRKISEVAPSSEFREEYHKATEIQDVPMTIIGVDWKEGDMGTYAVIEIDLGDGNDNILVSCGGTTVIKQLLACEQSGSFPVEATFKKMGRMWVLD